ncbi:MAG: hypothetical protein LAN71_08010 [Acidobacteriia bacterium]|nr:hypothetical protein [Terriglobia bacterium]
MSGEVRAMAVSWFKHTCEREPLGDKRRGPRMNSRVPVRIEWDEEDGQRVRLDVHTRVVNPTGCMMILSRDLETDHRVALTNRATRASVVAVVVSKSKPRPEGWEYGFELIGPETDFWGLEL